MLCRELLLVLVCFVVKWKETMTFKRVFLCVLNRNRYDGLFLAGKLKMAGIWKKLSKEPLLSLKCMYGEADTTLLLHPSRVPVVSHCQFYKINPSSLNKK